MGCVPSKDEPGPSVTGRDALWQSTLDPKKRSPPVLIELKSCQAAERKQYWTSNEYKRTMDPVIGLENGQLKLRVCHTQQDFGDLMKQFSGTVLGLRKEGLMEAG